MSTQALVESIIASHKLRRMGKSYVGPCPFCGGSSRSDKFQIRLDGGYRCYACNERGDIITWLRKQESLSCPDAHDRAGRTCTRSATCGGAEHCRYGGHDTQATRKQRTRKRRTAPVRNRIRTKRRVPIMESVSCPGEKFTAWAQALQTKAHARLLNNPEQLDYLASRGIDQEAVIRFGLGWLSHQQQVKCTSLGISDDTKEKIWVPAGLLIPIFQGETIHRLRIRRSPEERQRFAEHLKYVWVKGSGKSPLLISAKNEILRGVVVVEAELDAMAIASHHPDIAAIAVGTVAGGICSATHAFLQDAPVILVALDAEDNSTEAVKAWLRTYRHAKFYPTPSQKDPGDFYRAGGDLAAWLEPSLAPITPLAIPKSSRQDAPFLSARQQNKGEGDSKRQSQVYIAKLEDGRSFYLTDNRAQWNRLSNDGLLVFSHEEMKRFQAVTKNMEDHERQAAASLLLDVKEVFGKNWAYIRAGRAA